MTGILSTYSSTVKVPIEVSHVAIGLDMPLKYQVLTKKRTQSCILRSRKANLRPPCVAPSRPGESERISASFRVLSTCYGMRNQDATSPYSSGRHVEYPHHGTFREAPHASSSSHSSLLSITSLRESTERCPGISFAPVESRHAESPARGKRPWLFCPHQ